MPNSLSSVLVLVLTCGAAVAQSQAAPSAPAQESGWLGVVVLNAGPDVAHALQMDRRHGVVVIEVTAGSAAERAGLRTGDVILSYNGEALDKPDELPRLIAQQAPGAEAQLEIWREGAAHHVQATLGTRPAVQAPVGATSGAAAGEAKGEALGLALRGLTPAEAQALGVKFGLVIERVDPAAKAPQLARGDVIIGINNAEFSSIGEFNAIVAKQAPGTSVALRVRRGDAVTYVPVKVGG